jgi:hypothetical protein
MWPRRRFGPTSDPQAFGVALQWAASLLLAADNNFVLAMRLPSGTFKSLFRKYF